MILFIELFTNVKRFVFCFFLNHHQEKDSVKQAQIMDEVVGVVLCTNHILNDPSENLSLFSLELGVNSKSKKTP